MTAELTPISGINIKVSSEFKFGLAFSVTNKLSVKQVYSKTDVELEECNAIQRTKEKIRLFLCNHKVSDITYRLYRYNQIVPISDNKTCNMITYQCSWQQRFTLQILEVSVVKHFFNRLFPFFQSSQNRLLIKNGRVVNDDGMEDADVYIEDGIIK